MDKKSKKRKQRPEKSQKAMRDVIPYHDVILHEPLRDVTWSSDALSPQDLLYKHLLLRPGQPLVVKVAKASLGDNLVDAVAYGQVFLIKGWERQQRVVIRDHQRNRTLSVPFYWPVRFRHKDNKLAKTKAKPLRELLHDHKLPVHVYFDKLHKWKFHVGKREVTNFRFGSVEVREVYMEHFIVGMPITRDGVENEARAMLTLPLYANARFVVAEGLRDQGSYDLAQLTAEYDKSVADIAFSKLFGTEDAFLYKEEHVFFNKSATYHLSAGASSSPPGSTSDSSRLNRQAIGDTHRLLPGMARSLEAAGKDGNKRSEGGLDENQNDVNVRVEVDDKSSSSGKETTNASTNEIKENGTIRTSADIETEPGESDQVLPVDSDVIYATKMTNHSSTEVNNDTAHAPNGHVVIEQSQTSITAECHAQPAIEAPQPEMVDLRDVPTTSDQHPVANGENRKLVDLRDIPPPAPLSPKYGSNENLMHDEDAHFSAPWGFMGGGRYRSLVTVSHAGSDIVSDYEDDASGVVGRGRDRRIVVNQGRYGSVAGHGGMSDSPMRRKAYVTRSVHDVRPSTVNTRRAYSLKRVQGSGPMKYYVPDSPTSPVRTYSVSSSGSHRNSRSPFRLSSSGHHRDTMSEIGVPTYRRSKHNSTLHTDIPEYPAAPRGTVYSIDGATLDSYEDYDTVDRGGSMDVYFRERQPRRVKPRSMSARRPTEIREQHYVVEERPIQNGGGQVFFGTRPSNQQVAHNHHATHALSLDRGRSKQRPSEHERSGYVVVRDRRSATLDNRNEARARRRTLQGPVQQQYLAAQVQHPIQHNTFERTLPPSQPPVEFTSSLVDISTGKVVRRRSATVAPSQRDLERRSHDNRRQMEYNARSKSLDRPARGQMRAVPIQSDGDDVIRRTSRTLDNRSSRTSHDYRYTSVPEKLDRSDVKIIRRKGDEVEMLTSEGAGFYQQTLVRRNEGRRIEALKQENRNSEVYFDESDDALSRDRGHAISSDGYSIDFKGPLTVDTNIPSTSHVTVHNTIETDISTPIRNHDDHIETHVPVQLGSHNVSAHSDKPFVNAEEVEVVPQSPPPPPPPPVPSIGHVTKSKPATYRDTSSAHRETTRSTQSSSSKSTSQQGGMKMQLQDELKSKLAKRSSSRDNFNVQMTSQHSGSSREFPAQRDIPLRKKDVVAMNDKDYKANSLRQVITRHRTSLENIRNNELLSVAKSETSEFEDVLNTANTQSTTSTSPDAHDTLKSSGYGSVSSKPEVTKSTISSPYIKPLPSPTRAKHAHTNLDNPWLADLDKSPEGHLKVEGHHEGHHVRESIMSIHELDEYLRSQGVESDDETARHYEGTEMGITDFELTHL